MPYQVEAVYDILGEVDVRFLDLFDSHQPTVVVADFGEELRLSGVRQNVRNAGTLTAGPLRSELITHQQVTGLGRTTLVVILRHRMYRKT